ncbi:hypothetical protein PVT71_14480 [Salipiger sp. H15]|uniref:Uncharacterized protein n=1 Tax=Alloyangia sp. H15 TaxID=3029062 RepID=A0AAU8ANF8_9RHOB
MVAGRDDGDNDWEVLRDGHQVGRIYATMLPDPERSWMWFTQAGEPEQGYAESMGAALDEVRRRFC